MRGSSRILPLTLTALVAGLCLSLGCGQNLSQSSAPYNQDTARTGASRFGSERPRGQDDSKAGSTVGGSSLAVGVRVTRADVAGEPFGGDATKFLDWAKKGGFDAIGLYGIDPTSDPDEAPQFWFDDIDLGDGSKLSDHGFVKAPGSLADIAQRANEAQIGVQVDLTRLALSYRETTLAARPWAGESLETEQLAAVCTYLCGLTGVDSLTGRGFPSAWIQAAGQACKDAGKTFFVGDASAPPSWDFVGAAPLDRGPETLGASELAMAWVRSRGHQLWAGVVADRRYQSNAAFNSTWGSLEEAGNALLYRVAASEPQGVLLDMPPKSIDSLDRELLPKLKQSAAMRQGLRPVCCLVPLGSRLPASADSLVNGVLAAGMRLEIVEAGSPALQAAKAVWIVAMPGADGEMPEMPQALVEGASVAGKVAVLQLGGPIPALGKSAGWDAARRAFGLGDGDIAALDAGPKSITFAEQELPCAAPARGPWGAALVRSAFPTQTEVLAEGASATEGADPIVVLSRLAGGALGERILVNGSELAADMAFPLSQLLSSGRGLQAPSLAWCSAGSPVTVFAAGGAATVKLAYLDADKTATLEKSLKRGAAVVQQVAEQSRLASRPPAQDQPRR